MPPRRFSARTLSGRRDAEYDREGCYRSRRLPIQLNHTEVGWKMIEWTEEGQTCSLSLEDYSNTLRAISSKRNRQ
ncbi:hypothetical protein PRIPAC_72664 [Pristionchus pacificus]|uniref:Uncharacterized protein n=1 Tax=Pristionchus pacificus TaxID=54126 RepID=A0A2A6BRG6_PRIPA|nr:hypothetical protein PRIPAC_72664 [Pristionchus pacificus]|eukprot:PDM68458.1 hypothetical protein PRIPAC_43960 [Pristionchus pacificus]